MGARRINPLCLLVDIEREFYNQSWSINDLDVIEHMIAYANQQLVDYGTPIKTVTKHMVNFYQGVAGARKWRQIISEKSHLVTKAEDVLLDAYKAFL